MGSKLANRKTRNENSVDLMSRNYNAYYRASTMMETLQHPVYLYIQDIYRYTRYIQVYKVYKGIQGIYRYTRYIQISQVTGSSIQPPTTTHTLS